MKLNEIFTKRVGSNCIWRKLAPARGKCNPLLIVNK